MDYFKFDLIEQDLFTRHKYLSKFVGILGIVWLIMLCIDTFSLVTIPNVTLFETIQVLLLSLVLLFNMADAFMFYRVGTVIIDNTSIKVTHDNITTVYDFKSIKHLELVSTKQQHHFQLKADQLATDFPIIIRIKANDPKLLKEHFKTHGVSYKKTRNLFFNKSFAKFS